MDSLRNNLKVENTPVVGQNVRILMQCIKKEKELQKKWDKEDGIDITAADYKPEASVIMYCLKSFVNYRNAIIKFHYSEVCANRAVEIKHELDFNRRNCHNSALSSLNVLNRFFLQNGFNPLYTGEPLSEAEIDAHNRLDVIEDMSNVILKLVSDLDNYNGEFTSNSKKELTTIINSIHHFNKQFKVIKPPSTLKSSTVFKDSNNRSFFVK